METLIAVDAGVLVLKSLQRPFFPRQRQRERHKQVAQSSMTHHATTGYCGRGGHCQVCHLEEHGHLGAHLHRGGHTAQWTWLPQGWSTAIIHRAFFGQLTTVAADVVAGTVTESGIAKEAET